MSCYVAGIGRSGLVDFRHDQCVALWRRTDHAVELVRYWELERVSGQKHHVWPLLTTGRVDLLLDRLLAEEGLTRADVAAVWGIPGYGDEAPRPDEADVVSLHSLCHLASAVLMDTELFRRGTIIGLAIDGGPDFALDDRRRQAWYCGCVSVRGRMTVVPIESPGLLYGAASYVLDQEPGTLMALATATPFAVEWDLDRVLAPRYTGREARRAAVSLVAELVAAARDAAHADGADLPAGFSAEECAAGAVMKVVQAASEEVAVRTVRELLALGGVDPAEAYLAVAGGSALNCPTNTRLVDEFGFRGLLAPPCANDSGQALGLGLLAFWARGDFAGARRYRFPGAFAGSPRVALGQALDDFADAVVSVDGFDGARFAEDVVAQPVAWVEGAAEIGPRALGHRSLLADPRSPAAKDRLNQVKGRQWWRPVAPIVLEEAAGEWLGFGRPSPYMLEVAHVPAARRQEVPAIAHLDGTARLQTVAASEPSLVRRALEAFHQATGVPLLCNTSLNDRGEPIVGTAAEAVVFCLRKELPVLYVDGSRIELRPSARAPEIAPRALADVFDDGGAALASLWGELAAAGFTDEAVFTLALEPQALPLAARGPGPIMELFELAAGRDPRLADSLAWFRQEFGRGAAFRPQQPRFRRHW